MRSLVLAFALLLGLAPAAQATGPAVVAVNAPGVAVQAAGARRVVVRRGPLGRRVVVRNRGAAVRVVAPAAVVRVNGFRVGAVQVNRFNAFGTATFVDGFGNVFVIDAVGNTHFVGNAFNRGFVGFGATPVFVTNPFCR